MSSTRPGNSARAGRSTGAGPAAHLDRAPRFGHAARYGRAAIIALAALPGLALAACGGEDGSAAWEGDDARMEEDARLNQLRQEDSLPRPGEGMSPWDDARERGIDFRAVGQEPGWLLEIDEGNRTLVALDYGERRFSVPTPEPERGRGLDEALTIYRVQIPADRVLIEIRSKPCQDSMSGEDFEATVLLEVDGVRLNGCGRALR